MADQFPPGAVPATEEDRIKFLQAIYHTLTGKTEKLSRQFTGNYRVLMDDIRQLNAKMHQTSTQWHVVSKNDNVQIVHAGGLKQQFSSVERFLSYDSSITSPVESVNFEFNLLVTLPAVDKPQPYKVTLRILSRVAVLRTLMQDSIPSAILRFFKNANITAEVEYVDYNVARTLISALESWIEQIHTERASTTVRVLQAYSHWIPRLFRLTILVVATFVAGKLAPVHLGQDSGVLALAQFATTIVGFSFVSYLIAGWIGSFGEMALDSVVDLSYVNLNRGDERLVQKFKRQNLFARAKTIASIPLFVAQSAVTESAVNWLIRVITRQ